MSLSLRDAQVTPTTQARVIWLLRALLLSLLVVEGAVVESILTAKRVMDRLSIDKFTHHFCLFACFTKSSF